MAEPPNKLWAILASPYGHVGMIGATVDRWNRTADLAIILEQSVWGRGIGTAAWTLALDWLLGRGGMRKVTAGMMAENKAMLALARKSGMVEESRRRGQFLLDGKPVDAVLTAKDGAP
jgi:RimJ/RimL family protein N-acetyltransferase